MKTSDKKSKVLSRWLTFPCRDSDFYPFVVKIIISANMKTFTIPAFLVRCYALIRLQFIKEYFATDADALEHAGSPPRTHAMRYDSTSNPISQHNAGPLDLKLHHFVLNEQGSGIRKSDLSKDFNSRTNLSCALVSSMSGHMKQHHLLCLGT